MTISPDYPEHEHVLGMLRTAKLELAMMGFDQAAARLEVLLDDLDHGTTEEEDEK